MESYPSIEDRAPFGRIPDSRLNGYHGQMPNGLWAEAVCAYSADDMWCVFITDGPKVESTVVACSIEAHRLESPNGYVSRVEAMRIAKSLCTTPTVADSLRCSGSRPKASSSSAGRAPARVGRR